MDKAMNTISEAASKKSRGRPKTIPKEQRGIISWVSDGQTERCKQDKFFLVHSMGVLQNDKRFSWLCDEEEMQKGTGKGWKPSILSELGRYFFSVHLDEEKLKDIALEICEAKPKTKDAVAMLRRYRLGRGPGHDHSKLWNHICEAVNGYARQHAEVDSRDIAEVLRGIADQMDAGPPPCTF
jgi:hypothetical protein